MKEQNEKFNWKINDKLKKIKENKRSGIFNYSFGSIIQIQKIY